MPPPQQLHPSLGPLEIGGLAPPRNLMDWIRRCVQPQSKIYADTATGTHMPFGITQCYLPPGRGDIPAFTPAEAGTRLSDPGGMQG